MAAALFNIIALSSLLYVPLVAADEMAWGDVAADGSLQTRSLDVPVPMARGAENFFEKDPMSAHDWTHVSVVNNSLYAQISVAAKGGMSIKRLEDALEPIYKVMPKEDSGLLGNATVRYALHRYFTSKTGWAIKGLQPAGGSWIKSMSVTPDVKEISKYMVPTYLQDVLMRHFDKQGTDLRSLAILVATLDHLVHGEMMDILYSVYSTIGLPTAGGRSQSEIDEILDLFMMVYAFGFNLEASTYTDMIKARHHLQVKHAGWPPLRAFANDIKKSVMTQSKFGSEAFDFHGILEVIKKIGNQYAHWQSRDCFHAKELFSAMPDSSTGRVLAKDLVVSRGDGHRPLFTESMQNLQKLGVLEGDHLLVPNYLNSQSMCLSTASFYTACCPNECESLLGSLERDAGASAMDPVQLNELMRSLAPTSASRLDTLKAIAGANGGVVPLHSRSFAFAMHSSFPMQCPQPSNMPTTNPKTADEWMKVPDEDIQGTEDMMTEIAAVLSSYTAMGEYVSASDTPEDEVTNGTDIIRIREPTVRDVEKQPIGVVFYVIPVVSMLGLAVTAVNSGLSATGFGPKKVKGEQFDYWA